MILSMHRILNCSNYCKAILFIIWQQCDAGLKDLLVKKIMYFHFSVLLKCQVLHFFWHLLKNKMSCEIFSQSREVTSEELANTGLFNTFSFTQKFRNSFPSKASKFCFFVYSDRKKNVLRRWKLYYFCSVSFYVVGVYVDEMRVSRGAGR